MQKLASHILAIYQYLITICQYFLHGIHQRLPSLSQVKPGVRMLPIPLQPQQLVMRARACAIPPLPRAAPAPATLPVAGQSRSWKVTTMAHGAAAPHRPVTPGQRRRAGPRPPRDGAAGPGLDHPGTAAGHGAAGPGLDRPGTALPGRASTTPGRRRRAGPRLARDGGRERPIRRARLRGLAGS